MSGSVEAWLVRVAHRKAIDITRQLSRRARMVSPTPPEELPECENGVEGASISNCDIWQLVAALPLRQQQAIACPYLGGLSYQAAAELIGSKADAGRRAAAEGVRKLRKRCRHDW